MSARKEQRTVKTAPAPVAAVAPRAPKKSRGPRVRLTHLEIRRGERLRLRIAVADDALADVGDELGTLIKKIAPSVQTSVVEAPQPPVEAHAVPVEAHAVPVETSDESFIVTPQHEGNDVVYHEKLREHLVALFGSLCDSALADALDIAREERARRAEGSN